METLRINFVGSLPGASSGNTIVLRTEDDYCYVSSLLRDDLAAAYRSIWVREEHHFSWLKAQFEHCGLSHQRPVAFARTTPSSLLRENWGIEIPDWLTDQLIIEAGLLNTALPSGIANAATGLLAPLLGTLPDTIPVPLAGALAEKLSDANVATALAQPILKAAWQSLLDQWCKVGSPLWAEPYCKRLGSNPKKLWSDLTVWRLLERYPGAALDYALDPAAAIFVRGIPGSAVQEMSLNQEGRRLAFDQIEQIFLAANAEAVTRAKFTTLLGNVSGELPEEFAAIESILAKADFDITPWDIAEVEKRFRGCAALSATRFSNLRLYVRPPRPEQIEKQSPDAAGWVRWARDEYLPYRWWQIERREYDEAVERSVAAFSQWYCQHFGVVQSDPNLSAIQLISRWRESILKDKVSLILLVDNLPWFFWELLEKALAAAGLHRHESKAAFVPLPSHTSVCKPFLISGGATSNGTDYLKMLTARSKEEWQDRAVHYAGGVDQLASMISGSERRVILLNYLAGDETLHKDAEASGSSWTEQLGLLYQNLAHAVGDFARGMSGSGRDFTLYVLTDHGSTLILPEERRAADAQLSKKLFPNEKHRSASLSAAEADLVPENLWKLGHRFAGPFGEGDTGAKLVADDL